VDDATKVLGHSAELAMLASNEVVVDGKDRESPDEVKNISTEYEDDAGEGEKEETEEEAAEPAAAGFKRGVASGESKRGRAGCVASPMSIWAMSFHSGWSRYRLSSTISS